MIMKIGRRRAESAGWVDEAIGLYGAATAAG